ncbi:hypothetical protein MMC08_000866 [Hypocenomyce scalaris]|nr:hypothetical protein [Hypocenomyce scalaris]
MSQSNEPSVLDYARFYGLAQDHLMRHPLSGLQGPDNLWLQLEDPAAVFHINTTTGSPPAERLSASKEVAILLSSIITPPHDTHVFDEAPLPKTHRRQNLKMELSVLRTMHELDVLEFQRRIVPDLASEHLPLEKVDEEKDEGLAWPSSYHHLPQKFIAIATSEKLEVSRETLRYLESVLEPHKEGGSILKFRDELMSYKMVRAKAFKFNRCLTDLQKTNIERVTPPLLPLSSPEMPFVPSSDIGHLELLSDHTSPTKQVAHDLGMSIMTADAIIHNKISRNDCQGGSDPMLLDLDDLGELYTPLKGIQELPSSPPIKRVKPDDLKVECPLTPPLSEQPTPWETKSVSFREALLDIIPDMPPPIEKPEDISSEDIDAFFAESIAPIAEKANRRIDQEQLQEADTTRRVTVPIMDFSLSVPPWKVYAPRLDEKDRNMQKQLLIKTKADHFKGHFWSANGKVEREMRWAPFPKELGRIAIDEDITDDGTLTDFVAQPECVDTNNLVWKPEGFRILDEVYGSDEEELEHGIFPEPKDIVSLVKKRKLDLQNINEFTSDIIVRDFDVGKARELTDKRQELKPSHIANLQVSADRSRRGYKYPSLLGGAFSTLGALDSFIGMRSGEVKKFKLVDSLHFSTTTPHHNTVAKPEKLSAFKLSQNLSLSIPARKPLPLPDIVIPEVPRPFVISSNFSSNKKLFRRLQQLFPAAEFIERDFTLYSSSSNSASASKTLAAQCSAATMTDEADIILSPGIGLIYTTLQKIKQRAPPGQVSRSSIRERILRTLPRYEKLLVIVSEGRLTVDSMGGRDLDTHDCQALTEFITFCAHLVDEAQVIFVGGGEEDIAQWVAGVMASQSPFSSPLKLLQDETLWEIVLRRAGMNAYGAQVVLAELKASSNEMKATSSLLDPAINFGLTAFVNMSVEERLRRFETLFGGRQLLLRVSKTLDAQWL